MININELFNLLDDWKNLPSYQLERIVDVFFALHLKEILLGICASEIDYIIPEFPIRKGSLPQNGEFNINPAKNGNQSFKIDYLAYSKSEDLVYFIELKTEMSSRNQKQDWYLESARELGMYRILEDLRQIYKATNSKGRKKYFYLLDKLNRLDWIKGCDKNFRILKSPQNIEIVYIQPTITENDKNTKQIISFEQICNVLKEDGTEPITERFLESLKKWGMR
ncbi:hypothetical protein [Aestuariivivens sediminicola]|uniref:hypothetical protein n=1 Tax=Aestuariivivens sediminicola TaxID=2913560 RepID=UPI001F57C1BB|nr:hypothetical protein [Aestuariivivens sediminicola]